jgi:membrane protease subunit HflK
MRVVTPKTIGARQILFAIAAVVVVIWFLTGGPFYIVGPEEQGVVLTFGRLTSVNGPGFHLKLPWPIQTVTKAPVNVVQRIEIGFRSIESGGSTEYIGFSDPDMLREGQMLTGDENIINCSVIVQYRISSAPDYLFNVREPAETLRDISEASIRQVIGDNAVDAVLTTGKLDIQTRIMDQVQEMADDYGMGLHIVAIQLKDVQPPAQVSDAFKDVATAREDMQAYINDAEGYRNQVIPEARADSVTMVNEALGYAAVRINTAQGAAERFTAVAAEYSKSPAVTASRLHLEMIENVMGDIRLTVVAQDAGALTHYSLNGGTP